MLEKVKTVGDAYICVGGMYTPGDNQAIQMIEMSIRMIAAVRHLNDEHHWNFNIRIGIGAGSLSACVLGHDKISFDCFGPAVDIAHHLESTSRSGSVQVCKEIFELTNYRYQYLRNTSQVVNNQLIECYLLVEELGSPLGEHTGYLRATRPASPIISTVMPKFDVPRSFPSTPSSPIQPNVPLLVPVTQPYKLNKFLLLFNTWGKNLQVYQTLHPQLVTNHRILAIVQSITCIVLLIMLIVPYPTLILDPGYIMMMIVSAFYMIATIIFLTPLGRLHYMIDVLMTFTLFLSIFSCTFSSSLVGITAGVKSSFYMIQFLMGIYMMNGFVLVPLIIRVILSVLITLIAVCLRIALLQDYFSAVIALATGITYTVLHGISGYMTTRSVYLSFITNEQVKTKIVETNNEHKRNDAIIYGTLPATIVKRLEKHEQNVFDVIQSGTICFINLDGLGHLLHTDSESTITMLNRVFTYLDALCDKYKCQKIKSFGTVYLAIHTETDQHCELLAQFAIEALDYADMILANIGDDAGTKIGMNTGRFCAGVLGSSKFLYDVFGDAVNVASRMMTTCEKGKIQVSQTLYGLLQNQFNFTARGSIQVKGKGTLETWYLESSKDT
jgi:class 3 adenylate cyclase